MLSYVANQVYIVVNSIASYWLFIIALQEIYYNYMKVINK